MVVAATELMFATAVPGAASVQCIEDNVQKTLIQGTYAVLCYLGSQHGH